MQPGFFVVILAWKTQVDGGCIAIPIRVLLGVRFTKGFAFPAPSDLPALVCCQSRGHQVIGVQVVHGVTAAYSIGVYLRHRGCALPEVVSDGLPGRGGFADQQALEVVVIDGRSAAIPCTRSGGHFASALAAGIIDIGGFQVAGFIQFRPAVGVVVAHGLTGPIFQGWPGGFAGLHQLQPVACRGVKVLFFCARFHFALPVVVHKNRSPVPVFCCLR